MSNKFNVGEMVVYGVTGVCEVQEICMKVISAGEGGKMFYVLKPLYQEGTITVPCETKIFMRPVISEDEARKIVEAMPSIDVEPYHDRNFNQLAAYYDKALSSPECMSVAELAISLYKKKACAERDKKKLGQVDLRYMKRVDNLLCGELSVALSMTKSEVENQIIENIKAAIVV